MPENLTRGTTPTATKDAIDFLNYRHTVARTEDFQGDAAWSGERYKLVVRSKGQRQITELYDLLEDPSETTDLSESQPQLVKQMQQDCSPGNAA